MLQAINHHKNLEIEIIAPAAPLPYDRQDVFELVGNLGNNACKWAQRQVRIEVAETEKGLHIRFDDDGPGCQPADREKLLQRGVRLD